MAVKILELQDIYSRDYVLKIDENGCYELLEKVYEGQFGSDDYGESGRDLAKYLEHWPDVDFEEIHSSLVAVNKKFAAEFREVQEQIEKDRALPGHYLGEFSVDNLAGSWNSRYSIAENGRGSFTVYRLSLEPGMVWIDEQDVTCGGSFVYYCEERGMDLKAIYEELLEFHEHFAENFMAELSYRYPDQFSDCGLKVNKPLEGQLVLPFMVEDGRDISDVDHLRDEGEEAKHRHEMPEQVQVATEIFPTKWVAGLMQRARKVLTTPSKIPQGWTKMNADFDMFLTVFKSLRLKNGMVLQAYQWRSGGNGYGVVCAIPQDFLFPEPEECEVIPSDYPKEQVLAPQGALSDPMEAIEGDLSLWSYLEASIFARELGEIGAMWHGINWWTHKLLDRDHFSNPDPPKDYRSGDLYAPPDLYLDNWDWLEPQPEDWRPTVTEDGDLVTVVFYTYSGLGRNRIYRHVDKYRVGNYCLSSERSEIAECAGGFMF